MARPPSEGAERVSLNPVRHDLVSTALTDWSALQVQINKLTEDEVTAALEFESSSRRRETLIRRLIRRKLRLAEIRQRRDLEGRYLNG